jgi:hypothetical protein
MFYVSKEKRVVMEGRGRRHSQTGKGIKAMA